ncbi:MAG TPA: VIT and VWA domain-containing protein [Myxococcota bacterium]|nr:VIT and VWA domain-containing protein [Myxococcota bacterium]
MFGRVRAPLRLAALVTSFLFAPEVAGAGEADALTQTLSPYFVVEGGDPSVDRFPLEGTHVDVAISGVIAEVTVTQTYGNDGTRPINARYVFPASTRAAVNGMRMTLRDQVIEAEIQERKQAERTFETAKREGKTASLLEQQRPNVFTMNVANVLPGDRIEVTLRYTELLVPTDGRYEFVFPTVVGPRYASQRASADPGNEWVASPTLHAGEPPPAKLTISGAISAGMPIQAAASPSHALEGGFAGRDLYRFELDAGESAAADRDFVLAYRLAGDAIASGLSLFDAGDEKLFLLMVEPPARVAAADMPPREIVFIVDVSGSMMGYPLATAKQLLRRLAATLRPIDSFNVLTFAGGSNLLAQQSLPATPDNVAAALSALDQQYGGGSTELLPALERALALSPQPGLSRSFLIITDGYVAADDEALAYVAGHLGEANVFAFGIGSSVNRHLIEGLARAGQGEPFVVTSGADAFETADRFARYVEAPVLTDVRVHAGGFDAYALLPRAIPDVLASRPVVVIGKWRGERRGALTLTGTSGGGPFERRFDVASVVPLPENRALPVLWARTRIAALSHYGLGAPGDDARGEILALGLRYRLLTPFTSFVAVSKTVRNTREPASDVKQPLPLPAGVSDAAVGGSMGVGAEPELGLVALLLGSFAAAYLLLRERRAGAAA